LAHAAFRSGRQRGRRPVARRPRDDTQPALAGARWRLRAKSDSGDPLRMTATGHVSPRDRWILHFTHIDNLPMIVKCGRLVSDTVAQQGLMQAEVGDLDIKEARRRRVIPTDPGGTVGDYVPFYFAPRSPMMYRIACDHRDGIGGRYPDGDRPLVYLAATVGAVIDAGLTWVATDGNAATATTEFSSDLDRLDDMIDWPLMKAT